MIDTPSALDQLGTSQRNLMETLQHHPQGQAVDALVERLGITANAVRQHLTALEKDGWVQRQSSPARRGRPSFSYTLSRKGQEAFPRRYADLAASLIAELSDVLGEEQLHQTMARLGQRAARDLAPSEQTMAAPDIANALHAAGYDAELEPSAPGYAQVAAHNCVFHKLAEAHPAVCAFDLAFLSQASGQPIEHTECIVKGGDVCRFRWSQVDPEAA